MNLDSYLFIEYPKCSTCKEAKKYLTDHNIRYVERDIVKDNPTYDELKKWSETFHIPISKFFNTSGILYREMHLKEKLQNMSEEEMLILLSTKGMLVKRPLLINYDRIIIGFKEKEYSFL